MPDYGCELPTPTLCLVFVCTICCRGDELELSGVKWWTTGACLPTCAICIFMGKTDTAAAPHKQQSMVLVPMDTPGRCRGRWFASKALQAQMQPMNPQQLCNRAGKTLLLFHDSCSYLFLQASQCCGHWMSSAMTQRHMAMQRYVSHRLQLKPCF